MPNKKVNQRKETKTRSSTNQKSGVTVNVGGNPDRLSFSFGAKINMGNYESQDYHISMSSDLRQGETRMECIDRLAEFVLSRADSTEEILKSKTRSNSQTKDIGSQSIEEFL